jgi:Flp pilus assembly protein TadG
MRIWRDERGQSLVEFALVLPVLLLILVGIFNFGVLFYSDIVINEAARDAARYASIGVSQTEILQVIGQDCQTLNVSQVNTSISQPYPQSSGLPVTITITYPVPIMLPLSLFLPSTIQLQAVMTMRVE